MTCLDSEKVGVCVPRLLLADPGGRGTTGFSLVGCNRSRAFPLQSFLSYQAASLFLFGQEEQSLEGASKTSSVFSCHQICVSMFYVRAPRGTKRTVSKLASQVVPPHLRFSGVDVFKVIFFLFGL